MLHEVSQMFAIRKFPCAWHGKDIGIAFFGDEAQGGIGGKAGICDHHELLHPCWGDKVLQHLPKEDVLMAATCRVNQCEGHWDPEPLPTGDEQDHLKSKHIRLMLAVARRAAQGMLPSPLRFHRAVPD